MMSNVFVKSLVLASAICATSSIAVAQQWDAEVQAGRMRSALDAASTSVPTVAAGLNYRGLNSGIALFVGVPTSEGAPFWGSVSASRRVELLQRGGFVAGVDLSGNGYLMRDRGDRVRNIPDVFGGPQTITEPGITGGAFAGQALPVVGYEATRWQLHARAGASHYASRFGELERNHTVIISDVQLTLTPSSSFALVPVLRRYAADNTQDMYAGVSAIAGNDAGSFWGSVGTWPSRDTVGVSWGVGATLKVATRASLTASARRDAFDALYLNPAQTSWSLGFSVGIGKAASVALPVPAAYKNGRATIRLDAVHAQSQLMIAGDFTGWKPQPMQRTGNAWTYTADLAPGVYNYAFVDQQGKWFVPQDYPGRKDDGMGGAVAVLVVR